MIHIIRFAGELNVFHYCHSSEEVGGEGRRGCRRRPPRWRGRRRPALSREPTLSLPVRESRDARRLRLTRSVRVCVSCVIPGRSPTSRAVPRSRARRQSRAGLASQLECVCRAPADSEHHSYAAADGSADRRAYCLRAHGECDRSLHARARHTVLFRGARENRHPILNSPWTAWMSVLRCGDGFEEATVVFLTGFVHVSSLLINSVGWQLCARSSAENHVMNWDSYREPLKPNMSAYVVVNELLNINLR